MEEYGFHYKLEPNESRGVYEDRLIELIRCQFENILNLVIPVYGQQEVKVDGFKLLRDRETIYKIFSATESGQNLERRKVGQEEVIF